MQAYLFSPVQLDSACKIADFLELSTLDPYRHSNFRSFCIKRDIVSRAADGTDAKDDGYSACDPENAEIIEDMMSL